MLAANVNNYNYTYNYNHHYNNYNPNFGSKRAPFNLEYVLKNRSHLLPERVLKQVEEIVSQKPKEYPTLKEVHDNIYSKLTKYNSLEEAVEKDFPEFKGIKEATIEFKRKTGNIKKLEESGLLTDGLSFRILKRIWVDLKSLDEIAVELGLDDRSSLAWILKKIEFVNMNTNYKTLLRASEPETRKIIAAKSTAWNMAHPDLIKQAAKKGSAYMQTEEGKRAHSKRMKQHFIDHPERRQQVSENSKKTWSNLQNREKVANSVKNTISKNPEELARRSKLSKTAWSYIPEVRVIMRDFLKEFSEENPVLGARVRLILDKQKAKQPLTKHEKAILKTYHKAFFNAHPEVKDLMSKAFNRAAEEINR